MEYVTLMIGFLNPDWSEICINLKKKYKNQNLSQQVTISAYFETFMQKPKKINSNRI